VLPSSCWKCRFWVMTPCSFVGSVLTQYYQDDQIEKNEMGGECSTFGGEERCIQGFGGES